MTRRQRQAQTIEKQRKRERIERFRKKRLSRADIEQMNLLLMQAKKILGIL